MPQATNQQWVKTYGKLPWWRGPKHFRKLLVNSVVSSTAIEGVKIKPKVFSQGPHSFASTQLDLPGDLQAKCRAWVLANVAKEELSSLESQDDLFHVTVRYGLHDPDIREVEASAQGLGAVEITLGRVQQFEADEYDVVVIELDAPDALLQLRSALGQLPHTDTHPEYHPHVTLAYVQKGMGRRHLGDASFLGDVATLDRLRYSDSKENVSFVSLLPKQYMEKLDDNRQIVAQRIEQIVQQHPDWDKARIKAALRGEAVEEQPKEKSFAQPEFSRELTAYERKVDFKSLDAETTKLASQGADRIKKLLAESKDKLLAIVASRHKAGTLTAKFVLELELRGLGQLVPTLREVLGTAFRLGQREASKELKKTLAEQNGQSKGYQVKLDPTGLPPEKALEFFERKAVLWGANLRQPLLGEAKAVLFDGIKQGSSLRDLMAKLEQVFLPWLGDEDQMIDEKLLAPYRLETLVRTNTIEALNEGRKAQFQEAVDDGFVIGLQFSAVLDARTTPVCQHLDGKVFHGNSPELDRLTPPRHYSCRSIIVPVTRLEGPVQYITPAEVAKGVELSGKGFEEEQNPRRYEWNEEDHPRVAAGEEGGGQFAPAGGNESTSRSSGGEEGTVTQDVQTPPVFEELEEREVSEDAWHEFLESLNGQKRKKEYAADWDEQDHPREDDGKFAPKGSGSDDGSGRPKDDDAIRAVGTGKNRTFVNADGSPVDADTQARINALGIPPGWTGVRVSADPTSSLQAIGYDASGKEQPRYSKAHTDAASAAKHLRVAALAQDGYKKMVAGVNRDMAKGVEEAVVMRLVTASAMRIGGESKTAYGATTLEARHLSVEGDLVRFDFPAKSGKHWEGTIRDADLAKQVSQRLIGKSGTDRIFATRDSKVNKYLKQFGQMSAKDVRTLQGTSVAIKELKRLGEPKTVKEAKSFIKQVATKVSEHLRNTPSTAKKHYISPAVWAPIQAKFGIEVVK